ncbi:MAG: formylglycine-generating enzyme family protein, partial [Planctomycetota bacterium]
SAVETIEGTESAIETIEGTESAIEPAIQTGMAPDGRPLPSDLESVLDNNGAAIAGRYRHKRSGAEFVFVPAGSFTMGDGLGSEDERPEHEVTMSAFFMSQTEVTGEQYERFLADVRESGTADTLGHPDTPAAKRDRGPDGFIPGGTGTSLDWNGSTPTRHTRARPVVGVDWWDAYAYAQWAGGRLPTEAQWERAASFDPNGSTREYPWGNQPVRFAAQLIEVVNPEVTSTNARDMLLVGGFDDRYRLVPPGTLSKGTSALGIQDLIGNAAEWCLDAYDPSFYDRSGSTDPVRPGNADDTRVIRGGSWAEFSHEVGASRRQQGNPGLKSDQIGFRIVIPHGR